MLSDEEHEQVCAAIRIWVEKTPDEPVFGLVGEGLMRPKEILEHVKTKTEPGEALLTLVEHGVRRVGLVNALLKLGFGVKVIDPEVASQAKSVSAIEAEVAGNTFGVLAEPDMQKMYEITGLPQFQPTKKLES